MVLFLAVASATPNKRSRFMGRQSEDVTLVALNMDNYKELVPKLEKCASNTIFDEKLTMEQKDVIFAALVEQGVKGENCEIKPLDVSSIVGNKESEVARRFGRPRYSSRRFNYYHRLRHQ